MLAAAPILASGCSSGDETVSAPPEVAAPAVAPPLAEQVRVEEVAVYQGVKSVLVAGGEIPKKLNAPVIAGRPAFVRVHVRPIGKTRPTLSGEMRVKRAGKEDLVLRDVVGKRVVLELDEEHLYETLNFEIPAEDMTADASFSLRVGTSLDAADLLTYPADGGAMPFGAKTTSNTLRVKFVPISYEEEGTPLLPELEKDLAFYRDTLYSMYPVATVDASIRAPFRWGAKVEPDGDGWGELLQGLMQLRRADKAPRDVYYIGVFTPKATLDEFCRNGGCVLGIAPQAQERDVNLRIALVLGYRNRGSAGTLAQELAHAMGRMHAPCGRPDAIDPDFPYGGGGIGVWGYDLLTKEWKNPGARLRDFMSYCSPVWISDYTWSGLFERMDVLTQQQAALDAANGGSGAPAPAARTMQTFMVGRDGKVSAGGSIEDLEGPHGGDTLPVTYESSSGVTLSSTQGYVRKIAGIGGSIVVAPEAPAAAARARVGRTVTDLRSKLSIAPR
ncbi:MAG: hypothetical protein KF819_09095 [Labilithrix sp.]|nr:hypothetical protein [Labilithrix sp.]